MSKQTLQPSTRNRGIDTLRGAAILSVILLHLNTRVKFSETFLGTIMPKMLYNFLFWSGFYGVCIFFVISGFLITTSTLEKWNTLPRLSIKYFYALRFSRIMPLLVALLTVLSVLHFLDIPGFVIDADRTSLLRALIAALTFHINWLEINIGYLPASWDILWSLSIEEMFYLFFPIVCVLVRSERNFVFFIAIFLIISPIARTTLYVGNELADRNHFAYLDALAIGCCAAIFCRRTNLPVLFSNILTCFGLGCVTFIVVFRKIVFEAGLTTIGVNVSILAFGTGLILFAMQKRFVAGKRAGLNCTGFLSWIGRNSYEIYLTHMFVVLVAVDRYTKLNLKGEWTWFLYVMVIILSGLLGEFIARYFSAPLNIYLRNRMCEKSKAPS